MTTFTTEKCLDAKLDPIKEAIDTLAETPILSATHCDGTPFTEKERLPTCAELAEVDTRLSNEIAVVEKDILDIKRDILDVKTDVVDIKGDVVDIKGDVVDIKGDVVDIKGDVVDIKGDVVDIKTEVLEIEKELLAVDGRLDAIEANPVLTVVGCGGNPLAIGATIPTCQEMTAGDSALEDRLDDIEAKSILTAVACNGSALPKDAKLVQCDELTTALQAVAENLVDCKNVPIADNTAMVTCANLGETLRALPCEILSKQSGQLLQCRADGIYYGIEPPADVAEQFVDAINGDDANNGTRSTPLKTFAEAYRRVPTGSDGCRVHLLENQTHNVGYLGKLKASMYVYTYGPQLDAISAQYYSVPQGWSSSQTERAFAIAATLCSTCTFSVYDGGYGAMVLDIPTTQSLVLHGIKLAANYGGKPVTSAIHIRGLFYVRGGLDLLDTTVVNANATGNMWFVASGAGGTVYASHIKLSIETPSIAWLYPFVKLIGNFNGSSSAAPAVIDPQGSGLMIAALTGTTVLQANVFGAVAPKPQSPNFPTNL